MSLSIPAQERRGNRHRRRNQALAYPDISSFSPVPMRIMDGSEPGDTLPAAVVSGAPTDLQARTVRYALLPSFDSIRARPLEPPN